MSAPADRIDVSEDDVRRLLRAQFPAWAELPIRRVREGWDNHTFRVGESLAVRIPAAERYAAAVAREHDCLARLAPHLPLPIPEPVASGRPQDDIPWAWSTRRWIDGESGSIAAPACETTLATELGRFLVALQAIDATDGPEPGPANFHRGGALATYDAETRAALAALESAADAPRLTAAWNAALSSRWEGPARWVHGDVAAGNLLLRDGRLAAVIDFGCVATGDPACDTVVAWTLFDDAARAAFRNALPLDDATWARGRGWALWKAVITLQEHAGREPRRERWARRTLERVLADTPSDAGW